MNTPLEEVIMDLLHLLEHYDFIERHGKMQHASTAIKAAIQLCEKRLQEEADVITEAFNAAGGHAGGQRYFEQLYRQGPDAAKSYYGFKYAIKNTDI